MRKGDFTRERAVARYSQRESMTQSTNANESVESASHNSGPALFGNVWVTSSEGNTLHVAPDCPRLRDSARGPVDREKFPNASFCQWCAGHATNDAAKGNDREHYNALRENAGD